MKIKTAIVLAGGKGMRLRPHTDIIPKPLIEIDDKPIIEWIVEWLISNGIKKIVIGVAYQKEKIFNWAKTLKFKDKIVFSNHLLEDGTGGGFKKAIVNGKIDDEVFLAMNGDELTDLPLEPFYRFHIQHKKSIATILATPLYSNFGVLEIDRYNYVTKFEEKPIIENTFINSGVYLFNKSIFEYLPNKGNIEQSTFEKLAEMKKITAFRYYGFWRTVNTEKDLEIMKKEIELLKR